MIRSTIKFCSKYLNRYQSFCHSWVKTFISLMGENLQGWGRNSIMFITQSKKYFIQTAINLSSKTGFTWFYSTTSFFFKLNFLKWSSTRKIWKLYLMSHLVCVKLWFQVSCGPEFRFMKLCRCFHWLLITDCFAYGHKSP